MMTDQPTNTELNRVKDYEVITRTSKIQDGCLVAILKMQQS
jgi:hypothetical protein